MNDERAIVKFSHFRALDNCFSPLLIQVNGE